METLIVVCVSISSLIIVVLTSLVRRICRPKTPAEICKAFIVENVSQFSDFSPKSLKAFHYRNMETTVMVRVEENGAFYVSKTEGLQTGFCEAIVDVKRMYGLPPCTIVYYTGPDQKHNNLPILQNVVKEGGILCPVWFWDQEDNCARARKVDLVHENKTVFQGGGERARDYAEGVESDPNVVARIVDEVYNDPPLSIEEQAKYGAIVHIEDDRASPDIYWKVASGRKVKLNSPFFHWFTGLEEHREIIFTREFCAWYMFQVMMCIGNKQHDVTVDLESDHSSSSSSSHTGIRSSSSSSSISQILARE